VELQRGAAMATGGARADLARNWLERAWDGVEEVEGEVARLGARGIERGSSGGGGLRLAVVSGASLLELCSRRKKAGGGSEVGLGRQGRDEVVRYDEAVVARMPRIAGTWARRRSRRVTRHSAPLPRDGAESSPKFDGILIQLEITKLV